MRSIKMNPDRFLAPFKDNFKYILLITLGIVLIVGLAFAKKNHLFDDLQKKFSGGGNAPLSQLTPEQIKANREKILNEARAKNGGKANASPAPATSNSARSSQTPAPVPSSIAEKVLDENGNPILTPRGEAKPGYRPLNSQETLGDLSRMRSQRQIMEQQLKIAELQRKLDELNQPPAPAPVVIAAPPKPKLELPELTPPEKKPPVEVNPGSSRRRGPSVVSVQGSNGSLRASIRTTDGSIITIKNGGAFNGGSLRVSRKGVEVHRRDGKIDHLPFE